MAQHHKYSITEIEEMMPYERDLYASLLMNFLEEENEELKKRQNG